MVRGGWFYDVEENIVYLSRDIQLDKMEGKFFIKYEPIYTPEHE